MRREQLPDRRIDVQLHHLTRALPECREIDRELLTELRDRPATTGYLARQIDEQAGYVSQRLSYFVEEDVCVALDRGYYEISVEAINER